MQILISSVKIPERVRKDLGDVDALMHSLKHCGQLNPITVTREMELIAGHRRITAAKRLGWQMIDANVVDGISEIRRLEIELEENIHRKDFSPEELLDGVKRLEALRHPKFSTRVKKTFGKIFGKLAFWKRRKKPDAQTPDTAAPPHIEYTPMTDDEDGGYGI